MGEEGQTSGGQSLPGHGESVELSLDTPLAHIVATDVWVPMLRGAPSWTGLDSHCQLLVCEVSFSSLPAHHSFLHCC